MSENYYIDNQDKLTYEELEELKEILENASSLYYNTDKSLMSDESFDSLKEVYESYENVDDLEVGSSPLSQKGTINISHDYENLAGSLNKVNDIDELNDFVLDVFKKYNGNLNELTLIKSLKFDGNSVTGEFNSNGELEKMLTRGRNGKGLDLTQLFKDVKVISDTQFEEVHGDFAIKFEAIITYDDFSKFHDELPDVSYANPRSLVAGILGRDDSEDYIDWITLVPLEIRYKEYDVDKLFLVDTLSNIKLSKHMDVNLITESMEILTIDRDEHDLTLSEGVDTLIDFINEYYIEIINGRDELNYMVDGLVIEVTANDIENKLGYLNDKPRFSTALKFPYMEKQSVVTGFEFDLGKTGRLTPMCLFEPVEFNGAIQRRVSLANYKRFNDLQLGIGSPVIVEYRN